MYADPGGSGSSLFTEILAASGHAVAIAGGLPVTTEDLGSAVHLFAADTGEHIGSVRLAPPDYEGIRAIALDGPYLAVASGNYDGGGRVWAFAR